MGEAAGKVALVTGAAQGLGQAIAAKLAANGARVALADIGESALAQSMEDIAAQEGLSLEDKLMASKVDVADSQSVAQWVDEVRSRWGRIDYLVNNAGIQFNQASVELSDEEWRKVLGVDLDGVFYCCRQAGAEMLKQGSGAIVNISSIATRFGLPRRLPYAVSKSGIEALTRVLAAEWAESGIRVNGIAPGYIETEMNRHAFSQGHIQRPEIEAKIALSRLADPQEIAEAVLFLLSDRASYVTGQTLFVDGGYSIKK